VLKSTSLLVSVFSFDPKRAKREIKTAITEMTILKVDSSMQQKLRWQK